jgi:hypothetical protein
VKRATQALTALLASILGAGLLLAPLAARADMQFFVPQTGTISSATSASITVTGYSWCDMRFTGNLVGTINPQVSIDGVSTQNAMYWQVGSVFNGIRATSSTTINGNYAASVAGYQTLLINVSAYTSGTLTWVVNCHAGPGPYNTALGAVVNPTTNLYYVNGGDFSSQGGGNNLGVQWTTQGGSLTLPIAGAAAGPSVIKASAGRLARVLATTTGATTAITFYDNASACSGTIIGFLPATVAAGTVTDFSMPAANGITACGGTGSAAVSVSFY